MLIRNRCVEMGTASVEKLHKPVLSIVVAMFIGLSSAMVHADDGAEVFVGSNGLSIMPKAIDNFKEMHVRIVSPSNDVVVETKSLGEPFIWVPALSSAEGQYKYEILIVSSGISGDSKLRLQGDFDKTAGLLTLNPNERELDVERR